MQTLNGFFCYKSRNACPGLTGFLAIGDVPHVGFCPCQNYLRLLKNHFNLDPALLIEQCTENALATPHLPEEPPDGTRGSGSTYGGLGHHPQTQSAQGHPVFRPPLAHALRFLGTYMKASPFVSPEVTDSPSFLPTLGFTDRHQALLPLQRQAAERIAVMENRRVQLWPKHLNWAYLQGKSLCQRLLNAKNFLDESEVLKFVSSVAESHKVILFDNHENFFRFKAGRNRELKIFEHVIECCYKQGTQMIYLGQQLLKSNAEFHKGFSEKKSFEAGHSLLKPEVSIQTLVPASLFEKLQEILIEVPNI